ncbi:MAG: hypothetical protein V7K98_28630 [Nostoc sp.]
MRIELAIAEITQSNLRIKAFFDLAKVLLKNNSLSVSDIWWATVL